VWFIYSLLSAFFLALTDAFSKKALITENTPFIAWVRYTYAVPFLLLTVPFIEFPKIDSTFILTCILLVPLEITAILLYVEAIKISPLSMTLPFLSFTPLFLIMTSYLILGELPDKSGFVGILLVASGAYLLNIHTIRYGILEPLRAIRRERGSLLMIVVAFIFSITSNLGKIAIQHTNPLFFSIFYIILLSIVLLPIMLFKNYRRQSEFNSRIKFSNLLKEKNFFIIGICYAIMVISHFKALMLIEVPYMISVKRTSLIFGIILGAIFFKEANIKEKLIGGIIMIIGLILISVF